MLLREELRAIEAEDQKFSHPPIVLLDLSGLDI